MFQKIQNYLIKNITSVRIHIPIFRLIKNPFIYLEITEKLKL